MTPLLVYIRKDAVENVLGTPGYCLSDVAIVGAMGFRPSKMGKVLGSQHGQMLRRLDPSPALENYVVSKLVDFIEIFDIIEDRRERRR